MEGIIALVFHQVVDVFHILGDAHGIVLALLAPSLSASAAVAPSVSELSASLPHGMYPLRFSESVNIALVASCINRSNLLTLLLDSGALVVRAQNKL